MPRCSRFTTSRRSASGSSPRSPSAAGRGARRACSPSATRTSRWSRPRWTMTSGTLARTWRDDLRPALRDAGVDLRSGSGFEGVASDGDGTIVLLQEEQARLLVVAPDLSRLLHTLVLAVPADDPVLNPAWRREPNSRGEGLLLLRRGHVLIAKERDAPCLIEFGPPGDRPDRCHRGHGPGPARDLPATRRHRDRVGAPRRVAAQRGHSHDAADHQRPRARARRSRLRPQRTRAGDRAPGSSA